jgi:hypothetical protein
MSILLNLKKLSVEGSCASAEDYRIFVLKEGEEEERKKERTKKGVEQETLDLRIMGKEA